MKALTVATLLVALVTLTGAADPQPEDDKTDDNLLVKRYISCPIGWTGVGSRCFRFFGTALTWAGAERYCQARLGNLVSIHSLFQYRAVQGLIWRGSNSHWTQAWIGGSDAQQVGVWLWSDGKTFRFSNWCVGEPNNYRRQACLQVNYSSRRCWDNVQCYVRKPFVCARRR